MVSRRIFTALTVALALVVITPLALAFDSSPPNQNPQGGNVVVVIVANPTLAQQMAPQFGGPQLNSTATDNGFVQASSTINTAIDIGDFNPVLEVTARNGPISGLTAAFPSQLTNPQLAADAANPEQAPEVTSRPECPVSESITSAPLTKSSFGTA